MSTQRPVILSTTWRDGHGNDYTLVDERLLDDARAALEAAEVEMGRLKRERDVLPTPDAANPVHLRWAADVVVAHARSRTETLCEAADRLEAVQAEKASVDALVERVARVIHDSDELFPPKEWEARPEALRNDYRANARALLAAGLLADSERSTES